MRKSCKTLTFLIIILSLFSFVPDNSGIKEKRDLLIHALQELKNAEQLEKILPIVKKDDVINKKVPTGKPVKEKHRISSSYGTRFHPIDKKMKFHSGIDFVAEYASTIHATADGRVTFAGNKGGYGKCVIIEHDFGFTTTYAHLTLYYTKKGNVVTKNEVIGFLGNTGKSTGEHLHYEIQKMGKTLNPAKWIE